MIIGLTGEMGAGKSTVIQMLKESYPNRVVSNIKFAQPLYDMQEFVYNRISEAYKRPPNFVKDRTLLQWLGTNWGRDTVSDTLWVDLWRKEAGYRLHHLGVITCDDVRFDNEAEAVRSMGGVVVKIFSTDTQKRIDTTSGIVHHKSEQGIHHKFIDYFIDNNGTLEDLKDKVRCLVEELNERKEVHGF